MEEELRELLQRKANSLPPHRTVPARMLGRAKRRMALNISGGVVALMVVVFGAYSGVRALTTSSRVPSSQPTPTESFPPDAESPSPTFSPAPSCLASDLSGTVSLEGAAGSFVGSILVTNESARPCSLEGRPAIRIIDTEGRLLDVQQEATAPWWEVNETDPPPSWPVVMLEPGGTAQVRTSWSNYCGDQQPATWEVVFRGQETLTLPDPGFTPMCSGPELDSLIQVGPIEPQS